MDIEKGEKWDVDLSKELQTSSFGIIVLTRQNLNSQWILYEAGAISKDTDKARLCPVLFDVEPTDVHGPLARFQATRFSRDDMHRLVKAINSNAKDEAIPEAMLDQAFDKRWPDLERNVSKITRDLDLPTPQTLEIIFDNKPPYNERIPRYEAGKITPIAEDYYVCVGLQNDGNAPMNNVSVKLISGTGVMTPRPTLPRQMKPRDQSQPAFAIPPNGRSLIELLTKHVFWDGSGNEWWKAGLEFRFADNGADAKILSGGYIFKFEVSGERVKSQYFWLWVKDWEPGHGMWEIRRLPENFQFTRMDGTTETVHLLGP